MKEFYDFNIIKTIGNESLSKRNYNLILKNDLPNYIKNDNIFYLLRKLFIILPLDKKEMYTRYYPSNLFFNFYFPTRFIDIKIDDYLIRGPRENDIVCND